MSPESLNSMEVTVVELFDVEDMFPRLPAVELAFYGMFWERERRKDLLISQQPQQLLT